MISIRQATEADLAGIIKVEQSWPEDGRASPDKFIARLTKFPQGFFLACVHDKSGSEQIVATITTMPLHYSPNTISTFKSWDVVTHNGYLPDSNPHYCNAIYIISGVIDSEYRGGNIFSPMVLREAALAQALDMRYVLAGAVIPGYKKFYDTHQQTSAFDYCRTRRGKHLVDPLLAMYESIGFSVPDEHHVLAEYYPDDASRNFAALVVRDLLTNPLNTS